MAASPAQIRANRRNAKKSSGPKSVSGKAKSAKNSVTHGLSGTLHNDEIAVAEVEQLASLICGGDTSEARLAAARRIAEEEVKIQRARRMRLQILTDDSLRKEKFDLKAAKATMRTRLRPAQIQKTLLSKRSPVAKKSSHQAPGNVEKALTAKEAFTPVPLEFCLNMIGQLIDKIDRYESTAIARRRAATISFEAAAQSAAVAVKQQ